MWDSNGHFPSGILSGTFFEPGNFDECLKITSERDQIEGKYCILEVKIPNTDDIARENRHWTNIIQYLNKWSYFSGVDNGICIPSVCSDQELQAIIPHGN